MNWQIYKQLTFFTPRSTIPMRMRVKIVTQIIMMKTIQKEGLTWIQVKYQLSKIKLLTVLIPCFCYCMYQSLTITVWSQRRGVLGTVLNVRRGFYLYRLPAPRTRTIVWPYGLASAERAYGQARRMTLIILKLIYASRAAPPRVPVCPYSALARVRCCREGKRGIRARRLLRLTILYSYISNC